MKLRNFAVSCALATAVVSSANAGVVLFDNFNSSTVAGNWSGDSLFVPVVGAVDLVGPGFFQYLAYPPPNSTGNSVDLDGSTGAAGTLQSTGSFAPGQYTLSFLLAGNMRGDVNKTTTISLGDWSTVLDLPSSSPYTLYTYTFTTTGGKLSFADNAVGNQGIGNLLDNVSLATAVLELSTWTIMLLGFGGLGFAGYRASRNGVAVAS
jgi:hypothetical protein